MNRPGRQRSVISEDDIGKPQMITHKEEKEVDSDSEDETAKLNLTGDLNIQPPKFMRSGTIIIEKEPIYNDDNMEKESTNEDDSKEIEMLQEQLTAINVQFKELQIQNMEKDNQLLSLEKSLQDKINEISRISTKNEVLSKCREELLEQSKEVNTLEQRILELEEEIRVMKAPKSKPVNRTIFVNFG